MKLNGDMLRDARDRKGLSQFDAAEQIPVAIATLNKAENGGDLNPSTGKTICDFYGLDLAIVVIPRVPAQPEAVDAQ